jgi:hypothetical protein
MRTTTGNAFTQYKLSLITHVDLKTKNKQEKDSSDRCIKIQNKLN